MRIATGLDVEDVGDGGMRLLACDWPRAMWLAWPAFAAGAPLAIWAGRAKQWVELGGGLLFCAVGVACVALSFAGRRDFEIYLGLDGISLAGFRGRGPFQRMVAQDLVAPVRLEIRPLPTPDGAPELDDRGGDLVLAAEGTEIKLARRVGREWRKPLEALRAAMVHRIPDLS